MTPLVSGERNQASMGVALNQLKNKGRFIPAIPLVSQVVFAQILIST